MAGHQPVPKALHLIAGSVQPEGRPDAQGQAAQLGREERAGGAGQVQRVDYLLLTPRTEAGGSRATRVLKALRSRGSAGTLAEVVGTASQGRSHLDHEDVWKALQLAGSVVVLPRQDGTIGAGTLKDLGMARRRALDIHVVRNDGKLVSLAQAGLVPISSSADPLGEAARFSWTAGPDGLQAALLALAGAEERWRRLHDQRGGEDRRPPRGDGLTTEQRVMADKARSHEVRRVVQEIRQTSGTELTPEERRARILAAEAEIMSRPLVDFLLDREQFPRA